MADFRAMKSAAYLIALVLTLCISRAQAQIFADFTVSHGGVPLGTFRARLDYDKAPRTCASFIGLATGRRPWIKVASGALMLNKPFYDGITFHRLDHDFVIQGGSPNGQGTDGPGFVIQDEFDVSLRHSGRYKLSMAKGSLPNSGGSQFFITLEAATFLDDKHSVFGEVIAGKELIDGFTNAGNFPADSNQRPLTPIVMESVVISGPSLAGFNIDNPALMLPNLTGTRVTPSRNAADSSFTMTFDRRTQHNYFHAYSLDLTAWTPFRQILSLDSQNEWPFKITGVTFNRFFSRMIDIDYSLLPNPPSPLLPAGARLTITDRAANFLTLVSNGSGGGTWSDGSGGHGNILSLSTSDGIGTTGTIINSTSNAERIPLAQVNTTLDSTTGPNSRNSFSLILSFHTATSGWTDGTASGGPNPLTTPILQHFTYVP